MPCVRPVLPALLGALFLLLPAATSAQQKIPVPGTDRHRVQYEDATVSANDLCPVLQKKLGVRKAPFYVNGEPIGFC